MMIFKIGQVFDRPRFLPCLTKKIGELWSTNYGGLEVELYPPKLAFSGDHILAARECCTPEF